MDLDKAAGHVRVFRDEACEGRARINAVEQAW